MEIHLLNQRIKFSSGSSMAQALAESGDINIMYLTHVFAGHRELEDLLHVFLSAHDICVVNTTALRFKEFSSDYWKTLYFERFGYMDTDTKFKQLFCQAQRDLCIHFCRSALGIQIGTPLSQLNLTPFVEGRHGVREARLRVASFNYPLRVVCGDDLCDEDCAGEGVHAALYGEDLVEAIEVFRKDMGTLEVYRGRITKKQKVNRVHLGMTLEQLLENTGCSCEDIVCIGTTSVGLRVWFRGLRECNFVLQPLDAESGEEFEEPPREKRQRILFWEDRLRMPIHSILVGDNAGASWAPKDPHSASTNARI